MKKNINVNVSDPKIIVINPSLRIMSDKKPFPIGPGYVLTPIKKAGFEFKLIDIEADRLTDEQLDEILKNTDFNIVLMGTLVTGYKIVKNICSMIKKHKPESLIIAGNSVASSITEHFLKNTVADIAIIGEGDVTTLELLKAIKEKRDISQVEGIAYVKDGNVVYTKKRKVIDDINSIPLPDWDIFQMEKYLAVSNRLVPEPYPMPKEQIKAFVINAARGCPFKCTFCYHVFREDRYRYRSAESILNEIQVMNKKWGINYISFFDDLTFFSVKQVETFVDKVFEMGLKFYWDAIVRADLFTEKDVPLLKRLKEAGCVALGYSLESAEQEILQSMNKKINIDDFINQKKALDMADINSFTSLVFGYPEETVDSIRKTLQLCYDLNIYPSSGFLLPQPGTPMYELAKEKGKITDDEDYLMKLGDRQDLRVNLTSLPDETLIGEVKQGLERISKKLSLGLNAEKLLKSGGEKLSKKKV